MANGSKTLGEAADSGEDYIVVVCEPCKRTGRYNVARLIETYGRDAALPDLLNYLTRTCDRPQATGHHRRCHAVYGQIPGLSNNRPRL